jgi:hypothetical protein
MVEGSDLRYHLYYDISCEPKEKIKKKIEEKEDTLARNLNLPPPQVAHNPSHHPPQKSIVLQTRPKK